MQGESYNRRFGEKGDLKIESKNIRADFVLRQLLEDKYELVLQSRGKERVLAKREPYKNRFYDRDRLIWAGDLNSDDKIDFVIHLGPYCPGSNQLFLSGESEEDDYQIIKQVENGSCV